MSRNAEIESPFKDGVQQGGSGGSFSLRTIAVIVFGDELWMLPWSWGELWKIDCLLFRSLLRGIGFPG